MHPNHITQRNKQLLENASELFAQVSERQAGTPDLKELQATIDPQALQIDFLSCTLGGKDEAMAVPVQQEPIAAEMPKRFVGRVHNLFK